MSATAVAGAEQSRWPVGRCSAPDCGAAIVWAKSKGGRMPVDAEPAPGGNVLLREWPGRSEPEAHVVGNPARLFGKTTYRSHFVSCVRAEEFRRPKRGSR